MKVNVSVGEAIDKMTILWIKMEKIKDPIKKGNVEREYQSIKTDLSLANQNLLDVVQEIDDLKRVNMALWDIEDAIRLKESKSEFDAEFVELARSVYMTNDQRFKIKNTINSKLNSSLREEKEHVAY